MNHSAMPRIADGPLEMRIATEIKKVIDEKVPFTDVNVRPGHPIFYHTPDGYRSVSEEVVSKKDVEEFCLFADPHWEKAIEKGDGQFDCGVTLKGVARLRCNFFRFGSENNVGTIIRRLPLAAPDIEKIGINSEIKRLMSQQPKGLFLVSGPTNSGKSTTIAAIVEYFNQTRPLSIICIEQPIEYEFERKRSIITQREVPKNVGSFELGVVSAKRQDPDIIMVGEIRDKGTVDAALMAACSGHLVLATTHSRSAQESCESLLSYYDDEELRQKRSLLASALIGINSQVLMPAKDRKSFVLGYELLLNHPQVANFIREGKSKEIGGLLNNKANASNLIAISLNERLAAMVEGGVISADDAVANAYDKQNLLSKKGFPST